MYINTVEHEILFPGEKMINFNSIQFKINWRNMLPHIPVTNIGSGTKLT